MNGQELYLKSKCPICKNPFTNDFTGYASHIKRCSQVNHNFFIEAKDEKVHNISIVTKYPDGTVVTWLYNLKVIRLHSIPLCTGYQYLEWFEPDFSNYKKLIKKVKTYIIMS